MLSLLLQNLGLMVYESFKLLHLGGQLANAHLGVGTICWAASLRNRSAILMPTTKDLSLYAAQAMLVWPLVHCDGQMLGPTESPTGLSWEQSVTESITLYHKYQALILSVLQQLLPIQLGIRL